jgi:NADH dehydrogenase [ubiquinone] 1 alpha subcomplex assembly factor 3
MAILYPALLRIIHPIKLILIQTTTTSIRGYIPHSYFRSQELSHLRQSIRLLTSSPSLRTPPSTRARTPHTRSPTDDRGPVSLEDTQTDFSTLDILGSSPPPTTAVDACLSDGFHLGNGLKIGGGSGCLLVGGEAFEWRPWEGGSGQRRLVNGKGQWDVAREVWALLELVWPKPGGWGFISSPYYRSLMVDYP